MTMLDDGREPAAMTLPDDRWLVPASGGAQRMLTELDEMVRLAQEFGRDDVLASTDQLRMHLQELLHVVTSPPPDDIVELRDRLTGVLASEMLPDLLPRIRMGHAVILLRVGGLEPLARERGQLASDQTLRAFATMLTDQMRPTDTVLRSDHAEFTAIADVGDIDPSIVTDRILGAWLEARPHRVPVVGRATTVIPGSSGSIAHELLRSMLDQHAGV